MAFVSELFDTLRDLLNDTSDTQVPFATKKLYLNRGIARMWPQVWRVTLITIPTVADTYDYTVTVPWTGPADYHILGVEWTDVDGNRNRFNDYDFMVGDEDLTGLLRLTRVPVGGETITIRVATALPFIAAASYAAAGSETWTGPDRAMGIPVYYAMSLITARKVDDRQDTLRYSTTQATNGVTDSDIMGASQMWMGQFELELAAYDRPLPIARD